MMKVDGIGKEGKLKIERRRVVKVERKKRRRRSRRKKIYVRLLDSSLSSVIVNKKLAVSSNGESW